MTDAAVIQGTFADFKLVRTRGCAQLVIEIPLEAAQSALAMFGVPNPSAEIPVAVARLQDVTVELTYEAGKAKADKPKSYAQRAGILSNDPLFWAFLVDSKVGAKPDSAESAAGAIRALCGVRSRRDLIEGTEAGNRFRDLEAEFRAWKMVA